MHSKDDSQDDANAMCILPIFFPIHLQLRASRHKSHGLPHTQISQNLLCTTKNCIELVRPVEHLNDSTHSSLRQTSAAENTNRLIRNLVSSSGTEYLQQTDWTAQMLALLIVRHVAHLVCDGFGPCLDCFGVLNHFGELLADDGLVDQGLAEDHALVGPLEALFNDCAGPAGDHAAHHVAFVVEV